jgi:YVTN family beta-propeller protein
VLLRHLQGSTPPCCASTAVVGILLALLSTPFGKATLSADEKNLSNYDLKTLAIVVNRDSSDVTVIDPKTDEIIKRIPLGVYTNAQWPCSTMMGRSCSSLVPGVTVF